jgi:thiamine biosynthesis protein ThiS
MNVTVNGEMHKIEDGTDLAQLLKQMELNADCVAVECNLDVVEREAFSSTPLSEGDTLEIVSFVGGG